MRLKFTKFLATCGLLLSAMGTNAANDGNYYLVGEWNGWNTTGKLAKAFKLEPTGVDNEYRFYISADFCKVLEFKDQQLEKSKAFNSDGLCSFKIYDGDNQKWYGPGESAQAVSYADAKGTAYEGGYNNNWNLSTRTYGEQASQTSKGDMYELIFNARTKAWRVVYMSGQNVSYYLYTSDGNDISLSYFFTNRTENSEGQNLYGKAYLEPGLRVAVFNGYYFMGSRGNGTWYDLTVDDLQTDIDKLTWVTVPESIEAGYRLLEYGAGRGNMIVSDNTAKPLSVRYSIDVKAAQNDPSATWTDMAFNAPTKLWYSPSEVELTDKAKEVADRKVYVKEFSDELGNGKVTVSSEAIYPTDYFSANTTTGTAAGSVYTPSIESDKEVSVFLEYASATAPYAYIWDKNKENGWIDPWPGTTMTQMGQAANGNYIYKWTYTGTEAFNSKYGIIFSIDKDNKITAGDGNFRNHGYYVNNALDPVAVITRKTSETQEEVKPAPGISVAMDHNYGATYRVVYEQSTDAAAGKAGLWLKRNLLTVGDKTVRTFCDHAAHELPNGVKAYYASGYDAQRNTITMTRIESNVIPANTGVILVYDEGARTDADAIYFNDFDNTAAGITAYLPLTLSNERLAGENYLVGSVLNFDMGPTKKKDDGQVSHRNYYFVGYESEGKTKLGFRRCKEETFTNHNVIRKAYLALPADVQTAAELDELDFDIPIDDTKPANTVRLMFSDEAGSATSISGIEVKEERKADGKWYDLMGQPVSHPSHGVYIHNGKKVVVK